MAVVVERSKLGRELRDDGCDKCSRQCGDDRCVEQRVKAAVHRNAELAAGDRVRDKTAYVEHHAGRKNEQALFEH